MDVFLPESNLTYSYWTAPLYKKKKTKIYKTTWIQFHFNLSPLDLVLSKNALCAKLPAKLSFLHFHECQCVLLNDVFHPSTHPLQV